MRFHVSGGAAEAVNSIISIGHQAPEFHRLPVAERAWQPSPAREVHDDSSVGEDLLTASALRSRLSRLYTRPARTPVTASRKAAHDSGPVWTANPSPYESCIGNTSPV
jgi:hypothetical protein